MALLYPTTGLADPIKFGNSLLAIDVAASTVLGMGVITGLLVGSGGVVAVGDALIGHVVTLGTAFSTAPLLTANATNYVYFQMPPSPICPDRTGKDPGVVVVNTSSVLPANSTLLAIIVTGAAAAITSVNSAPAGRRNLSLPLSLLDLRSVGPYNAGATYQAGNIVGYNGGGYIAKITSTGVTPVEGTSWGLVASAGAAGATGPTGASGTSTLAADTDVQLTSIADADLLTWSASASKWVNRALAALGLTNSVPSAETSGATGSAGTAITAARADHVHAMPTSYPPTLHAASHAAAGADAVSPASIAALSTAGNLSDLASASAARANLALGTAATANIPASGNASAAQVVLGNDTRLTSTGVSLSGVNPLAETVGAAASVGSAATAAHSDHVHAMPGVFGVSGSSHSAGFVPDPGATAGAVNYLREDGAWVTPAGGGTITSINLATSLLASASTVYVSGAATITETLLTQAANKVLAGPATGAAAAPTLRSLVAADILPALPAPGFILTIPGVIAAGADTLEVLLPSWYSSRALTRLTASLGTASTSGSVTLTAQLATATGVFTAAQTSDVITLASGVYQGTPVTSFASGLTGSGENRVRLNITGAGTGASNLTVKFEF